MKILKISLAVLVLAVLGYFGWNNVIKIKPPIDTIVPVNQFTDKVKAETNALSKMPNSQFCNDTHRHILFLIEDFYNDGLLGKDSVDNLRVKDILSRNLYATYSAKFIEQAFVVFSGSEWDVRKLNFIRQEKNFLAMSPYLKKPSQVNDNLIKIQQILTKYDEITSFITSCQNYTFSTMNPDINFPITESNKRIEQANNYLNNSLGNTYVNNCTKLHQGLKEINIYMFNAHTLYLKKSINEWAGKYRDPDICKSQRDYSENIFNPLKKALDLLDNSVYNVNNTSFNSAYDLLLTMLNADSKEAFKFFIK